MKEFKAVAQRLRDPVTKQWRDKPVQVVVRKRKGKRGKLDWDKLVETAA